MNIVGKVLLIFLLMKCEVSYACSKKDHNQCKVARSETTVTIKYPNYVLIGHPNEIYVETTRNLTMHLLTEYDLLSSKTEELPLKLLKGNIFRAVYFLPINVPPEKSVEIFFMMAYLDCPFDDICVSRQINREKCT